MGIRGSIPRSPTSILRDIERLRRELHLKAEYDENFRAYIYRVDNYPFRVLGFTSPPRDINEVIQEWEDIK